MLGQQNKSENVWESFDYPGDTWLTEMKMWKGTRLPSWKGTVDPSLGPFSLGMDPPFLVYELQAQWIHHWALLFRNGSITGPLCTNCRISVDALSFLCPVEMTR
ncbi:hypothetical protein SUGI_0884550 [Cryptomeria japonica]|nr:hypothetical protein SUGI_0884550 [Cryptomeria japonica]